MALGAESDEIRAHVIWQAMKLIWIGIVVGVPMALALTRILVSTIYGVQALSTPVLSAVLVLLMLAGFLASYLPSLKATRVSPCEALR
jgi:ABC-type antimicrobial peptide transport system permease subunit